MARFARRSRRSSTYRGTWHVLVAFVLGFGMGATGAVTVYSGYWMITPWLDHLAKRHCSDLQKIIDRMVARGASTAGTAAGTFYAFELAMLAPLLQRLALRALALSDGDGGRGRLVRIIEDAGRK
jgi:hypothetical protein